MLSTGERAGPPFKPCVRISRTRLSNGLSKRGITLPPGISRYLADDEARECGRSRDVTSPSRPVVGSGPAAGFTSRCGPRSCSLRRGFRRPARPPGSLPHGWSLLLGDPALTETGLSPALDVRRDAVGPTLLGVLEPASSRRTTCAAYPSRGTWPGLHLVNRRVRGAGAIPPRCR